jgi:hypothetical protein
MRYSIIVAALGLLLGNSSMCSAQLGVFTEFTVDLTTGASNVDAIIMAPSIGLQYGISNKVSLRAGISKQGQRSLTGGFYWKNASEFSDDLFFTSQDLTLSHVGNLSGNTIFGGVEFLLNNFMIGLDGHYHRAKVNGGVFARYDISTNNNFNSTNYGFATEYGTLSFAKLSLRLGYSVYNKPKGNINLILNYSRDISDNITLETLSYDSMVDALLDVIPDGPNTSTGDFSSFTNGDFYYERNYFAIGMNVKYYFKRIERSEK